jgi:CHASE3 domain sensor protein
MKRSILDTPRLQEFKKRKRKVIRNRIIFFAIIFLILFVGLAFLSHWKKINIEKIEIKGNRVVETQKIESAVNKVISGKYLWIFPKRNSLIYPTKKIKNKLSQEFKRLKDITIEVDPNELQILNITVSEYKAKYLWCGNTIPENFTSQQCYFLDSDGYIFDEAPYFSGEVYFKFYGNINSENPIGSNFSNTYFTKIISLKEAIEKMNLKPTTFYLEDADEGSIYLSSNFQAPNAPKIMFKLDSDYPKLIENLQSAITTEPLQTKIKTDLTSLLYVDLRFGNKVYFK